MVIAANDLHGVFSDAQDSLQVYSHTGAKVFACEARNAATGGTGFGHNAECPPGDYVLAAPSPRHEAPFGFWFTLIEELPGHHEFDSRDRAGIGIHGGGSGLPDPFAPRQGWVMTHGCIRLMNEDNQRFVDIVKAARAQGGKVYFTVEG